MAGIYRCSICGHEYDPKAGEPSQGIGRNVPFADLPTDWSCPVCGAGKGAFRSVV
ncbi:MAG: rubredoxin [Methanomicrobiales archaeon]|nr:rubredoxin [Methanomicrobiales archaeon]